MNRSDDVVSALLKFGAMSAYEKVFDVLGPCELWPEDVIDTMCQPVCSRTVEVIAKFCFKGGLPCYLLQDVLRDLPFESAPQDQVDSLPEKTTVPDWSIICLVRTVLLGVRFLGYGRRTFNMGNIGRTLRTVLYRVRSDQAND